MHKPMPRADIFPDPELNRQFLENGYFTVPLLDKQACADWSEKLGQNTLQQNAAFRFSIKSHDVQYKMEMLALLQGLFKQILPQLNKDYQLVRAVYLEKDTGPESHVALHTDDCCCDESRYLPFHIWMPLVDTTRENGCICVVKGSHAVTNLVRGIQIPQHYGQYREKLLGKYLTPLENKAGEALVYHPALLHYSYPNLSEHMRPAVVGAFIPAAAKPVVYFKRNKWLDKSVLEFEMTPEQYCHWNEKEEPRTACLRKISMPPDYDRSPDFITTIEHARQ